MPLSAEQQALFDHARRSLPRWLTRGKTAVLEWLHAYAQLFDSARAQAQDWLDITYLDNASGAELDQHALDRGTVRRSGETDITLRERLRNITDVVTEPALKDGVDALLAASGLTESAWVELRRDRAHCQLPYGTNYPISAAELLTATGFGTATAGYLCDETSGDLIPVFGAGDLSPINSPTYGYNGPRADGVDKAVGLDSATAHFDGGNIHNIPDDLYLVWLGKWGSLGTKDIIGKISGGVTGWRITLESTIIRFLVGDGATGVVSDTTGVPVVGEWYIGMAAVERGTGTLRLAFKSIVDGDQDLGGNNTLAAVGNITSVNSFLVGYNPAVSIDGSDHQIAALYVGTGVGVATGVTDNIGEALTNFRNYLFPRNSTAFVSRGYRMTNVQTPMGYIVILPYGTTAAMGQAVEEYLRQYGPAGYYYIVEIRANP